MRDQFRCMLKIGKIESWSGFGLFQPYFLPSISHDSGEFGIFIFSRTVHFFCGFCDAIHKDFTIHHRCYL